MKHPLAKEGKACPSKHHSLDKFDPVHLPFNLSV
jgi:hypothetical protein